MRKLYGNVLCEGAQGTWLDIDYGNYPYITSSSTLPYSACNLGIPPQLIRNIYGAAKIYDTRAGFDPEFPDELLLNSELNRIGNIGEEYGTTTGRKRTVNYLNVDKLIRAINLSGTTHIIISKVDVVEELGIYKYFLNNSLIECESLKEMKEELESILNGSCRLLKNIRFSNNPETV